MQNSCEEFDINNLAALIYKHITIMILIYQHRTCNKKSAKFLAWNCRGANGLKFSSLIKDYVRMHN